jgi:hypothetical protein
MPGRKFIPVSETNDAAHFKKRGLLGTTNGIKTINVSSTGFTITKFDSPSTLHFNVESLDEKGEAILQFYYTTGDVVPFCSITIGNYDNSEITFELLSPLGNPTEQLPLLSYHLSTDKLSYKLKYCKTTLMLCDDQDNVLTSVTHHSIQQIGAIAGFSPHQTLMEIVSVVESNDMCDDKPADQGFILLKPNSIQDVILNHTVVTSVDPIKENSSKMLIIILSIIIALLLAAGGTGLAIYLLNSKKKKSIQ